MLRRPVMKDCSTLDLKVLEIQQAEVTLIKYVQSQYFGKELECLSSGVPLLRSSSIRELSPILNKDGIICVGGRLKHARVPRRSKHPVLVPHENVVSKHIIRDAHNVAHLGVEWTLSLVREKFWVTKGRSTVKKVKRACVTCKRLYKAPCVQQMADLPEERLVSDRAPFTYVGCDCFGPFLRKYGRAEIKRYGLICTCLTIRAIHIEVLESLSTDSFLNGFRRFVARRGSPEKVFCDNGTNFVGAQTEVDRCKGELDFKKIEAYGVEQNMEWKFNPPHASHMGGVWERMIRSIRRVLSAVLKNVRLTDEILVTLMAEVESIINGRPLTKLSEDPNDPTPLTPNHLLMLRGGPAPVPGKFSDADQYRKRWRFVQHLSNQFWSRWVKEYLPELQRRVKWQDAQTNLKVGDLVLLVDENVPRRLWPLGLIIQVHPGRDGLVRSVRVKTKSTTLVRPVTKVVSLEAG